MADNRKYYIDGSTVRKLDYYAAEPARRAVPDEMPKPQVRPKKPAANPNTRTKTKTNTAKRIKDRRWVDDFKHGFGMICAAAVVVCLCFYILKLSADVKDGKNKIANLRTQLNAQLDENAEYSSGLDSMVNLEEIYNIATNELGMVYSEPGQTVYYSQSNDDYVVQYKDVPEAK